MTRKIFIVDSASQRPWSIAKGKSNRGPPPPVISKLRIFAEETPSGLILSPQINEADATPGAIAISMDE
jgi:hypothetical protein